MLEDNKDLLKDNYPRKKAMINNQFQSLDSIDGVEDISQENAAAYSGGRVILYDGKNEGGTSLSFTTGYVSNLGKYGFNDKTSSIEITNSQRWQFWLNTNFRGNSITYGKGKFNLQGIYNNSISSLSRTR